MMSLFPIPKNIEKKINRLRRTFLWQGNKEKGGYNLVKWESITLNRIQGGLGLKNLSLHYRTTVYFRNGYGDFVLKTERPYGEDSLQANMVLFN